MDELQVMRALAALAQPVRLRIFRTLVGAGNCGLVPSALCERLAIHPPTVSFHLKELMNAQLVSQQRKGRFLIYRASVETMNEVLRYLTAHCCQACLCSSENLDADQYAPSATSRPDDLTVALETLQQSQ